MDQAILAYAEKLTRHPAMVQRSDVQALRALGLSDEAILRVAEITSYFNFVNRMALGLSVALEPCGWFQSRALIELPSL